MSTKNKKLTPELQEKLNLLRGYSPEHIHTWTPPLYKDNLPKTDWPLFKFRNRNAQDHANAEDELQISTGEKGSNYVKTNAGNLRLYILRQQLTAWSNFKDKDGSVIEYKAGEDGKVHPDSLHRMSKEMQEELLGAINSEETLTEEELEGLKF